MTNLELAARLFSSTLFGTLIGIERQWHHKNAGIKTNTLVAVGSTAFGLISELGFGPTNNPAQVASGVVAGIGFIGAGVIMRRGSSVQGINSAATLWATASMGLAIGAGYYSLGWMVLLVVLGIQFFVRGLASWIDARSGFLIPNLSYKVVVGLTPAAGGNIRSAWSSFASQPGISTVHYHELQTVTSELQIEAEVGLSEAQLKRLTELVQRFSQTEGVVRAEWSEVRAVDSD
jgi:putative Mg2+ transporter-C (MgtC) family protein